MSYKIYYAHSKVAVSYPYRYHKSGNSKGNYANIGDEFVIPKDAIMCGVKSVL